MLAKISLVMLCVLPESQLSSLLKIQWEFLYGFTAHTEYEFCPDLPEKIETNMRLFYLLEIK
jgi:hypothetical protein